ncbi:DUF4124 domain-containing protein [Kangiella sediminilitoris]|uniref:DUF4124 domain-containing protein n=1 Tax=Kangiella sediminilitoris TaxID=1144748 RepID=A0A1B3BDL4_9GAMM|nr:DUF4124 domain-containing protein [Kangiella sediminilitoris]AOE50919.1 hypothetical protein KS2013_2214 [Kangiella sediminilitoris]
MRYLIGILIGMCFVLLFFGIFTIYQYYEMDRKYKVKEVPSQKTVPPNRNLLKDPQKPTQKPVIKNENVTTINKREPSLYTWKDEKGNVVISERPRTKGEYQNLELSEDGYSVVEMEKAKPMRREERRTSSSYSDKPLNPTILKQQLVARNSTAKCRWLVGRAYELHTKINQHSGANRSIHCDELSERIGEMNKLRREGESCYFPYGYSAKC